MSKAVITESLLTAIGDAIRAKNGASDTYSPAEMATAIAALDTSGGASYQSASGTITTDSDGLAYITEDELPFVPTVMFFGPITYDGHYMAPALFFGGDSTQVPYGQCMLDSYGVLLLVGQYSDTTLEIMVVLQGWNWGTTLMQNTSAAWYAYKF